MEVSDVLTKDLCKQIYLKELKEGDKTSIELWKMLIRIVDNSYNEGYKDGQQKRETTKT